MTKEQLKLIINVYQNYFNDFVNVTDKDLEAMFEIKREKELNEIADKLVPQILHKMNSSINTELAYSNLNLEGDEMYDAHDYVMTQIINKLTKS